MQFGINLMIFGYWRVYSLFGNLGVSVTNGKFGGPNCNVGKGSGSKA